MTTVISGSYPAINSDSDATVNGLTIGKGGGAVSSNTTLGNSSLLSNTTGQYNTAIGQESFRQNTTGVSNTGVGYQAGYLTTTGSRNSAFGTAALPNNTTASDNTAVGYFSLLQNTTGANNTSVGSGALASNTTASNNTAVGYQAGYSATTGSGNNVFIGKASGYSQTTGSANTFVGETSGYSSTTGTNNTFIGNYAGFAVTTGSKNTVLGTYNGNQGGLDIRTLSNRIMISDGDGNPRMYSDNLGTFWPIVNTPGNSQFRTYHNAHGTYANGATVDFSSMSGLIIVNNWALGHIAVWIVGGGGVTQISAIGGGNGTIAYQGSVNGYRWTNNTGSTYVFSFTAIATRPDA